MPIRLFDTVTQSLRDFEPRRPGQVGIYVCGPTVQSSPHIGHLRSALVYDLWRRWFAYRGFTVTLVRNVTDIDDKILAIGGTEEWWSLAARVEREFASHALVLGILPPTVEPRATGHITDMISLIARLIDRGHAYPAEDGTGDVFFSVASWPDYGHLTRQSPDDVESDGAADERGKRDSRDFALWKGRKSSEPETASWESPWGRGRPGWHIECSAMATRYLGTAFDIHGGGLDLRFPHHENELAQSRAAGDEFATTWLHNGLVTMNGRKMSKSLGNVLLASDLLEQTDPVTAGDEVAAGVCANEVAAMLTVLGLDGSARSEGATTAALGVLVERLVAERNRARSDHDWATADRIRDDIDAAGITLEDGADTTRWSING